MRSALWISALSLQVLRGCSDCRQPHQNDRRLTRKGRVSPFQRRRTIGLAGEQQTLSSFSLSFGRDSWPVHSQRIEGNSFN